MISRDMEKNSMEESIWQNSLSLSTRSKEENCWIHSKFNYIQENCKLLEMKMEKVYNENINLLASKLIVNQSDDEYEELDTETVEKLLGELNLERWRTSNEFWVFYKILKYS